MRRDSNGPTVVWQADVAADVIEDLKNLLPVTGARAWIIETGLVKFLEIAESSPPYVTWCHEDIQRHLHNEEKFGPKSNVNLRITSTLYNRFNDVLPEWGATSWFIRRLLTAVVIQLKQTPFTIDELVERSVNAIRADVPVEIEP